MIQSPPFLSTLDESLAGAILTSPVLSRRAPFPFPCFSFHMDSCGHPFLYASALTCRSASQAGMARLSEAPPPLVHYQSRFSDVSYLPALSVPVAFQLFLRFPM